MEAFAVLHKKTLILTILLITGAMLAAKMLIKPAVFKRWAVYYSDTLPYKHFLPYDIVAFDSDSHPDFRSSRREGQVILGYLSTSEAEEYRDYFGDIKAMGVLMQPSDLWQAHYLIDIRKPVWREYFVHKLVPRVMEKGFDGIMLDTIDTVLYLEEEHPEQYAGMKEAAIQLIADIRKAHPSILLMINRGFPALHEIAPYVDYVLAESIRAQYDFDKKTSNYFPQGDYDGLVAELQAAQKANPKLTVVTLDYWTMNKESKQKIRSIYAEQRSHGFIPYVTTPDLMHLHKEP